MTLWIFGIVLAALALVQGALVMLFLNAFRDIKWLKRNIDLSHLPNEEQSVAQRESRRIPCSCNKKHV